MSFAAQTRSSGLPTVLEKPCTMRRFHARVYAKFQLKFDWNRVGETRTTTCFESERRSEWISVTREKFCVTRASRDAIDPVVGTMLVGSTYTGRSPSPAKLNRTFGAKLRSISPCWSRFNEYVPATL